MPSQLPTGRNAWPPRCKGYPLLPVHENHPNSAKTPLIPRFRGAVCPEALYRYLNDLHKRKPYSSPMTIGDLKNAE